MICGRPVQISEVGYIFDSSVDMQNNFTSPALKPNAIFDVVIIGAGVIGVAIARQLSHYTLQVAVIEKEWEVGLGASCRNSGVIHAGIYYQPGSLRGQLCMEGRQLLQQWCDDLGIPYSIPGQLIVAQKKEELSELKRLLAQGEANGVSGLSIVQHDEITALQPGVAGIAALYAPSSGLVPPYTLTIAIAESAAYNGVSFFLDNKVTGITYDEPIYHVHTEKTILTGRWVINAAGLFAGQISKMLDISVPTIYPCRGEYLILDKEVGKEIKILVYPAPPQQGGGLGVHLTPTIEGNLLLGPSAEYISEQEDHACSNVIAHQLIDEATKLWPALPADSIIGAYAGLRAKLTPPGIGGYDDFFIKEAPLFPRFINLVGLESPALTAAPAIARYVMEIIAARESLHHKSPAELRDYHWPQRFDSLPEQEKEGLVRTHHDHGEIICRCEGVTKYELLQALQSPLRVKTLVGLKYRCRVMMGRCCGGYCLPRIVNLLNNEYGWEPTDFYLRGKDSPMFSGWVKELCNG